MHGECPPGTSAEEAARRNTTVYASPSLSNNSAATAGIEQMAAIFKDLVAVPFVHDWLRRSVASNTLSASVLSPPSSPIKQLETHHSSKKSVRLAPLSPSLSSASSLTESSHGSKPSSPVKRPNIRLTPSSPSLSSTSSLTESSHGNARTTSSPASTPTRRPPKQTFPISPIARISFSSSFSLDTGHVQQEPDYSVLSQRVITFLEDIGKASEDDIKVLTVILQSSGQELWATTIARKMRVARTTAQTVVRLVITEVSA